MAQQPSAAVRHGDELAREWLAWRGFAGALRAFDEERAADRGAGLSADRLTELIFATYVPSHDAAALCGLLDFLQQRFFARLDAEWAADVRKLESSVLRLFVVRALQAGRRDKVLELFDKEAARLLGFADDWQLWFTLPYVRRPSEDARFAVYFSRPWAEALQTSYRNLLASVFAALPLPALARAAAESAHARALEAQAEVLRDECARLQEELHALRGDGATPARPGGEDALNDVGTATGAEPALRRRTAREAEGAAIGGLLRAGSSGASEGGMPAVPQPVSQPVAATPPLLSASRRRRFACDAAPALRLARSDAFAGHASPVTCARFSPDGGCVASASQDGTVRIWDASAASEGSYDGSYDARDAHSGARAATLYCGGAVSALEWEPRAAKLLLLATAGGGLRAWNAEAKRLVCDAPPPPVAAGAPSALVRALRASPADASFAVATAGGALTVWGLRTFTASHALPLPEGVPATALAYNHNGRLLAAGCGDGSVRLFDVGARSQIMAWPAHARAAPPCSLQFGPDQTSVFSLGADGQLVEWSLHAERSAVRRIDVSAFCGPRAGVPLDDDASPRARSAPDDDALASASSLDDSAGYDGWAAGSSPADPAAQPPLRLRHELALQPAGRWALLTGAGCAAAAVDLRGGGAVRALRGHDVAPVTAVDWHPTAPALCLTGGADCSVRTHALADDGGEQRPEDDDVALT